ncbi:MAG: acyltransferase [Pseudomonadota bacterium]|nr:acyltransferase [Pseudomonadota bacterium]
MQWLSTKFELARNDGAGNVRPMEGLRGCAVFLVFLVHYATLMAPWMTKTPALAGAAEAIHAIGNAGVDLFFVLSGYLIYGSLMAHPQPYTSFMRRRIARIYPAFLAVFAVYLLLVFMQPRAGKIPAGGMAAFIYIVENLLLLPGIFKIDPIITVAWSLSYEMLYYLLLPPIILALGMRARSSAWRCTFFAILGVILLVTGAVCDGPMRLVMFIAGILLHEAMRAKMAPPRAGLTVALVMAGLYFMTAPYFGAAAWAARITTLFFTFFFLCLHCFSLPRSWLGHAFSVTPLRWLGNMSYSYYLLHGLALKLLVIVLQKVFPDVHNETLFVLGALPIVFFLTLIPAAALFLLVERPLSLKPSRRHTAAPTSIINVNPT